MKHLKRILSIILVLAVFAGSFVGSWHLFNQGMDLCQYFGHKKLNIFSLHDINT